MILLSSLSEAFLTANPQDRVPSFTSLPKPTETDRNPRDNMEYQQQDSGLDGLLIAKKRQDSATGVPTTQSPVNNASFHNRSDSSSSQHQTGSKNGAIISPRNSPVMQMESRIIKEFDSIDATSMGSMTIESFSDYIARERLSSMPHRGSLWDRVLRWAEFSLLPIGTTFHHPQHSFSPNDEKPVVARDNRTKPPLTTVPVALVVKNNISSRSPCLYS